MSNLNTIPTLLNYEQAAKALTISPVTLRRWVSQNKVPCKKIGGSVRFTTDLINAIIKDKNPQAS